MAMKMRRQQLTGSISSVVSKARFSFAAASGLPSILRAIPLGPAWQLPSMKTIRRKAVACENFMAGIQAFADMFDNLSCCRGRIGRLALHPSQSG
jgi:hypothetical protein